MKIESWKGKIKSTIKRLESTFDQIFFKKTINQRKLDNEKLQNKINLFKADHKILKEKVFYKKSWFVPYSRIIMYK